MGVVAAANASPEAVAEEIEPVPMLVVWMAGGVGGGAVVDLKEERRF